MDIVVVINLAALWIFVSLNFLLTIALIRRSNNHHASRPPNIDDIPKLTPGESAPVFKARTLEGEFLSREDCLGKSVIFVFISPTCRPCIDELPRLKTLGSELAQEGVEMILVNTSGNHAETMKFIEKHNISLPILITSHDGDFMKDYKVAGTPFYCMIDASGHVKDSGFLVPGWEKNVLKLRI